MMYTLGEVIDKIQIGQYAISHSEIDEGVIFGVREDGWIYVVYPDELKKRSDLSIRKVDLTKEKRYTIHDLDEEMKQKLESLPVYNEWEVFHEELIKYMEENNLYMVPVKTEFYTEE